MRKIKFKILILGVFLPFISLAQFNVFNTGDSRIPHTKFLYLGDVSGNNRAAVWGYFGDIGLDFRDELRFRKGNTSTSMVDILKVSGARVWTFDVNYSRKIIFDKLGGEQTIRPSQGNYGYLGTNSYRWYRIYANGLYVNGVWVTSDDRKKENIKGLESCLDKIKKVGGYEYQLKADEVGISTTTEVMQTASMMVKEDPNDSSAIISSTVDVMDSAKKNQLYNEHAHEIGFLAQELEAVFPELVQYNKEEDLYTVNYDGMVPVLLEALKEQQAMVEATQARLEVVEAKLANETNTNLKANKGKNNLGQNVPNPFSRNTVIPITLKRKVQVATLHIHDLNGNPSKQLEITQRGDFEYTIEANTLISGMYIYTLIADGQLIGTKRMIVE